MSKVEVTGLQGVTGYRPHNGRNRKPGAKQKGPQSELFRLRAKVCIVMVSHSTANPVVRLAVGGRVHLPPTAFP
jgi:hypothetical protein